MMIIEDPNVVGVHPLPSEDEAPALIDPHAVIAPEIAFEELIKTASGR